MAEDRLHLRVDVGADVDLVVGVFRAGQQHLVHLVRVQPFLSILRVVEVVAHGRVDGIPYGDADGAVVGVSEAGTKAVPGDDHVRPVLAQQPDDLAAQLDAGLQIAVRVAEEDHLLHAQHLARLALLLLPEGGQLLLAERLIVRAFVAAGGEDVVDRPALRAPLGDGAAAEELGVVRVSDDHHRRQRAVLADLFAGSGAVTARPEVAQPIEYGHR